MDLRRGRYLGVTPCGWRLWTAFQAGKRGQDLQLALLQQQGMAEELARATVCRFEQEMARLALPDPEPSRLRRGTSSFLLWVLRCCPLCWEPLDALLTLGGIRRLLHQTDGLLQIIALGQTQGERSKPPGRPPRLLVRRLCRWLKWASLLQRRPLTCLERSLALWWLLCKRGVTAHVVLGISTAPFTAHAWVEGPDGPLVWKEGLGWLAHRAMLATLQPLFHSGRDSLQGALGQEVRQ